MFFWHVCAHSTYSDSLAVSWLLFSWFFDWLAMVISSHTHHLLLKGPCQGEKWLWRGNKKMVIIADDVKCLLSIVRWLQMIICGILSVGLPSVWMWWLSWSHWSTRKFLCLNKDEQSGKKRWNYIGSSLENKRVILQKSKQMGMIRSTKKSLDETRVQINTLWWP